MPHIVFKGVNIDDLKKITENICDEISMVINRDKNYFSIELTSDINIFNVKPFVNIYWMRRPKNLQDEVASIIFTHLTRLGYENPIINFFEYKRENYYVNNKSLE